MIAFVGMHEAPSAEIVAARRSLTSLVASEVLRRQAAVERFLCEFVDTNEGIPQIARSFLRQIAAGQGEEDNYFFELFEELWNDCDKVTNLGWSAERGGTLVAEYADKKPNNIYLFWSATHFKQHHAEAIAELSPPGREALDWVLNSPGAWESIGAVRRVAEDGLLLMFELADGVQVFKRPLSPEEFHQRFKDEIAVMSYAAQTKAFTIPLWCDESGTSLDDVVSISENATFNFVQLGIQTDLGVVPKCLFHGQTLEEFEQHFAEQLSQLPAVIKDQLIAHMRIELDGPWLDKGRILSVGLTDLCTVDMPMRFDGVYRFHPKMPAGEFIEAVLPELTGDSGLRQMVIRDLNQKEQPWCRYGYVDNLQRHTGGAGELKSEDGRSWYLYDLQTVEEYLGSFVHGRKDLSPRAQDFIEAFAREHPEYFTKRGLVFSIEEDSSSNQVVFETLIADHEIMRLPIF